MSDQTNDLSDGDNNLDLQLDERSPNIFSLVLYPLSFLHSLALKLLSSFTSNISGYQC